MSSSISYVVNGYVTNGVSLSVALASQAANETANGVVTHVGVWGATMPFFYNGFTMSFRAGDIIEADAALYAAINNCPPTAAAITWSN